MKNGAEWGLASATELGENIGDEKLSRGRKMGR
jgi:hypothetical protein